VRVQGEVLHTAAEGNGPVNALDLALRKALLDYYPQINNFHAGRLQSPHSGFGSRHRSHHPRADRHRNTTKRWSTVGAGTNIIEASWRALADSVEYGLMVAH
jgi:2-isopropylmalate synthase